MSGHKIKLLREVTEGDKLAPQQKVIYDALLKIGIGKEVDREQFVKDLEASGAITTRQTVDRVVAYYLQNFTKSGIAESIKPPAAPKEEKEPKAKKSETKAAGEDKPAKAGSPADSSDKKADKSTGAAAA